MPDHTNHTGSTNHTHILLAMLGGQPQVVTFTLDLLLKDFAISDVIVIHPGSSQPRLQHALECLAAEFVGNHYKVANRVIHFHSHVLQLDGHPIDDIMDDAHADGTLNTIHQLIYDLKRQGHHIHLSVTGGRRLMSLLAISVAALNFDRHDHIWHIYTPEHIQEQARGGNLMHVPDDSGVKLIQGPFISLGAYIYNQPQSFQQAQAGYNSQIDAQERARCESVIKQLTPRAYETLRAFAHGLNQQEVARELGISTKTVDAYKTGLLDLCRQAWTIEPGKRVGYHFLYKTFAPHIDSIEYTSTAVQETSENSLR